MGAAKTDTPGFARELLNPAKLSGVAQVNRWFGEDRRPEWPCVYRTEYPGDDSHPETHFPLAAPATDDEPRRA
jgi:hypothetical protein